MARKARSVPVDSAEENVKSFGSGVGDGLHYLLKQAGGLEEVMAGLADMVSDPEVNAAHKARLYGIILQLMTKADEAKGDAGLAAGLSATEMNNAFLALQTQSLDRANAELRKLSAMQAVVDAAGDAPDGPPGPGASPADA